jgi:hypothetical protein
MVTMMRADLPLSSPGHGRVRSRAMAKPGRNTCSKEPQGRRHGAEPERVDDHQMVGPADGLLALTDRRRRLADFPLLRRPQNADFGLGDPVCPADCAASAQAAASAWQNRARSGSGWPSTMAIFLAMAFWRPRSRPCFAIDIAINRAQKETEMVALKGNRDDCLKWNPLAPDTDIG